ncbi:unnamed protein product, partial [Ascophyllum nodosum]
MIITTNTPMPVVTEAISKQGTKDASLGTRFVRKNGRNMKRGSLRRSQSLQVGTSKTQKLDAVAVAKESARIEEGRPETSYKPTKLGWREDGRPSNGRPMIVETAADAAELSQGRGDVFDMPPQPPKLGEAFRVRRPSTSSRARTYSAGPFEDTSSRSHHGSAISQDQRVRGTAEGRINASPPSPDGGVHDAPVQFQRMPKPPGWQEEQAVEIRRDWITYLAKGMGIDTKVHTGHELETLVVRRMLEQAEEDLLADSFDEWDTDDDEEDGRQYSEKHPQRRIPPGTRRSRSHSRSRQNTSTFSRLNGDNRLTSPPLSGRGDGGGDRPGSGKRPRGGALRHVLRRSQTTGDMDAPDKPRRRSSATQQAADKSRSQSRGRDGVDVGGGAGIGAPSPRRSQNEKGAFTLTELLLQDEKRASSSANAPSRRNDDGDRMDGKGGSRERGRDRDESRGRSSRTSSRDRRSRERKNADTVTESRSNRKSRSRGAEERAQRGDKGRSGQDVRSTRKDRPSVERRRHASGSKRSSSRDARVSSGGSTRSNTGESPDNSKAGERRVVTKTRPALSEKARMTGTLAAAVAGASAGDMATGVTTANETATRPARAKRSSDTTKETRSDAGDGDAAGGGGGDSRPPLGQHSNPAARSASGTTELRTRSRGERGLSAGAESRSGGVMDASIRRGEGERRARRASADTKRQRLPVAADDDDNEEDVAALARAAAKLLTNAVVTGAAADESEGTVDDPLNATDDLMNGVEPVEKAEDHHTAEAERIDPGDPQRFLKLRPYAAQASGPHSRPRRPLSADDSAAKAQAQAEVAETSVTTVAHPARTTRQQQYGSAVPPSSAPTPVSAPPPRGHDGSGERTATRQRSGGSSARDPGATDREAEPRRGRSRERRGGGTAGGAARSGAGTSGSGSRQGSDRPRGVVQSTGAAAAAEAAADDGRYGKDWDKLEMHRAVYASDTPRLRFFMDARPEGLKQVDHHGNTPLLLALKLARTEMAWMMIRAGAELDIPSDGSFHLLDEAIVLGDEDLLVEVYGRLQRQSWGRWRAKVPYLLGLLEDSIPDFYMEMHWSFECSNVLAPLVKAVAPHDHYRIWKRGSWLRMDSTITGYTKRLKTQRGNVSVLFLGNDSPGPGTLIKLDHGKKKIYNVLRRLESPTSSEVRRTCKRYLVSGQQKRSAQQNTALKVDAFVIKSSELDFKPVLDPGGQLKKGTVGPWTCDRYECTGDMQLQTFRKGTGDNLLAGLSMKAYFDASKTLEDKVLNASLTEATGAVGSASPGPGAFFNFGERAKEHQKAKSLAKLNTPHKRFDKKIKASMWMSQEFPLTLEHVTPMLEILSMQDKVIHKLKEVLTTKGMREAGFPAKVSLPLYLGVCAAVTFDNCRVFERGELEPELFLVNPSYSSSRRMRKGVFEGVMPGNILVEASSFSNKNLSGGGGAGEGTALPPVPIAETVSSTQHRASSLGRNVSSSTTGGRKSQQSFNIRQPSFGPGSPEAPIADIARAAKVKSAPLERVSSSAEAAIGGLSFEFGRKVGGRTSTNVGEGEALRGRKDAMTDGETAGPCTEDISRGNRAWDDLGGKGGGGEWQ